MRLRRVRLGIALGYVSGLVLIAVGCAQGADTGATENPLMPAPIASLGGTMATAGMGGGGGGSGGLAGGSPPMFMGQICTQGDTLACDCPDGMSMGTKVCKFDRLSPTMGAFGPCENCSGSMGGASGGGAGAGGRSGGGAGSMAGSGAGRGGAGGGMAGSSGGAGAGGMSGGAGGSSAGMGGSGGDQAGMGGSGGNMAECERDSDCPDESLLQQGCCERGRCGTRLLLSCNT
jgi:hypothetical protein